MLVTKNDGWFKIKEKKGKIKNEKEIYNSRLILFLISFSIGYGLYFCKFNTKISNIEKEKQILINSSVDLRKELEEEKNIT